MSFIISISVLDTSSNYALIVSSRYTYSQNWHITKNIVFYSSPTHYTHRNMYFICLPHTLRTHTSNRLLQQEYFIRARKVIVHPKPEEEEEEEVGGGGGGGGTASSSSKAGEGRRKGEKTTIRKRGGKVTDSPRAKKQQVS